MSPEFLRRAKRYQADLNSSDRATAQTVSVMAEQIHKAAGDPLVKQSARDAVKQWRGGPLFGMSGRDPFADALALAESCWWYAKHNVKFVHHNELIAVWFNEHDQLQLLISPEILVRMNRMQGDCAIYTMLIAAMLEALGVSWEIVTAAVNPRQPEVFSHVWPRVILPDGRRVDLDASHGDYVGWHVPNNRIYKVQVWDSSARPAADRPQFNGLHGYRMAGMGDDTTDFTPAPSQDTVVDLTKLYPGGIDTGGGSAFPTVSAGGPSSGFNWGSFVGNLANQWTQIGSRVLAPSTTYQRNADGSVSLVTPGSSPVLSGSVLSGGGTMGGNTLLWVGGGLVALVVVASMFAKGR